MDITITLDYDIAEALMQGSIDSGLSINELINLWLDPFTDMDEEEDEEEPDEETSKQIEQEIRSGWDDQEESEAQERIKRLLERSAKYDPYKPTF